MSAGHVSRFYHCCQQILPLLSASLLLMSAHVPYLCDFQFSVQSKSRFQAMSTVPSPLFCRTESAEMCSFFSMLGVQPNLDNSQTPRLLTRSRSQLDLQRQVQLDCSGSTTKDAASACELSEIAVIHRTTNKIIRTTRAGQIVGSRPKLCSPITITHSNSFSNKKPKAYTPRSPGAPLRMNKIKRTASVYPDEPLRSPKRTHTTRTSSC